MDIEPIVTKFVAEVDRSGFEAGVKYARDTKKAIDQNTLIKMQLDVIGLEKDLKQIRTRLKSETNESVRLNLELKENTLKDQLREAKRELLNLRNTGDQELSRLQQKFNSVGDAIKNTKFGQAFSGLGNIGQALAGAGISAAITSIASGAITLAGNLQQARIAFTQLAGGAQQAEVLLNELADFAKNTPFELTELREYSKRLLAYGYDAKSIIPILGDLGNIAAGVGKDKLPFLITALGQVRAKTILSGEELKQFTEAGVPLIEELAKVTGFGVAQIADKTKDLGISYQQVEQALKNIGGEGGKFGGLMQAQSQTFQGAISNLKDSINILGEEVGKVFLPILTKLVQGVSAIVTPLVNWTKENPRLAGTVFTIVGALLALVAGLGALGAVVPLVTGGLGALGITAAGLGATIATLGGPITLAIGAIVLLYKAYETNFGGMKDILDGWIYNVRVGIEAVKIVFDRLIQIIGQVVDQMGGRYEVGKAAFNSFMNAITFGLYDIIKGYIDVEGRTGTFVKYFTDSFRALGGVKAIVKSIMNELLNIVTFGMSGMVQKIQSALSVISKATGGKIDIMGGIIGQAQKNIAVSDQNKVLQAVKASNPFAPIAGGQKADFNKALTQLKGPGKVSFGGVGGGGIKPTKGGSKGESEAQKAKEKAEKEAQKNYDDTKNKGKRAYEDIGKAIEGSLDKLTDYEKKQDDIEKKFGDLRDKAKDAIADINNELGQLKTSLEDNLGKQSVSVSENFADVLSDLKDKSVEVRQELSSIGVDFNSLTDVNGAGFNTAVEALTNQVKSVNDQIVGLDPSQSDYGDVLGDLKDKRNDFQGILDLAEKLQSIDKEKQLINANTTEEQRKQAQQLAEMTETEKILYENKKKTAELEEKRAVAKSFAGSELGQQNVQVTTDANGNLKGTYVDEAGQIKEITDFKNIEYARDLQNQQIKLEGELEQLQIQKEKEAKILEQAYEQKKKLEEDYTGFFKEQVAQQEAMLQRLIDKQRELNSLKAGGTGEVAGATNTTTNITQNNTIQSAVDFNSALRSLANRL